jgi:phosphoglycolate phosphatase-like HAD superfamily hydrolase
MRGNGAVARLFLQALREVYALPDEIKRVDYGGKTDGQIVLETLALHDIQHEAALELLPQFNTRYRQLMDDVAHELHHHVRILPGVVPLLQRLREYHVIQTLLTGNMEPVAELKLRALDLQQYFDLPIGAYGSDDRDRTKLVPIAQRKAAVQHGTQIGVTVVIGDTPRDIACGKAGNARTVAVATGSFSVEQLEAHQPDAVLADLSDTDAAVTAILQGH